MPFSSPPPRYVSVFGLNENTVAATQSSKKRTIQQVNTIIKCAVNSILLCDTGCLITECNF